MDAVGNPALLCVMGNHLIIHLKEAAEKGLNEGTSYRLETLNAIEFGRGPDESIMMSGECWLLT